MTGKHELLMKIKALQEEGVGGEREAAEAMLARLMDKYGISPEELEELETHMAFFRFHDAYDKKLLLQILASVIGWEGSIWPVRNGRGNRVKKLSAVCTRSQELEIRAMHEFYRDAFGEEMEIFFRAFILKHSLFPFGPKPSDYEQDDEERVRDRERSERIRSMMDGMEERHMRKMLEDGE